VQSIDRDGRERSFSYDVLDRQTQETWWAGSTAVRQIDYGYDAVGNLVSASDPDSSYAFTYDTLDRVTSTDNAGTPNVPHVVLSYAHDAVGNLLSLSDNSSVQVSSTYDPRDLLVQRNWTGPGQPSVQIDVGYDVAGQMTALDRWQLAYGPLAGVHSSYANDPLGRLQSLTHTADISGVVADYHYTYDGAGQLLSETHHGQTYTYQYDSRGQLTAAQLNGQPSEGYGYDANGNRSGASVVIGADNRLQSDGTFQYAYDGEGNLIRKVEIATGAVTSYSYDYRNRLVAVEQRDGNGTLLHQVQYTYDVFDRRIVQDVDGVVTATVYNGNDTWADYNAAGQVAARYLYGDGIDRLLARFRPGEGISWYLTDHLGTVRDIVTAVGGLLDHRDYDSFGNVLAESNPGEGDRFGFMGREFDVSTGLYYFRGRYYDPQTGRFLSQDSWGFAAADANLYRFVGNAPLTHRDPLGHVAIAEERFTRELAGAVAGSVAGFACGLLEALAEGAQGPEVARRALQGAAVGALLGWWLGSGSRYAPEFTAAVGITLVGYAGYNIGQSPTAAHAVARIGCTIAAFVAAEAVMDPAVIGRTGTGCFVAGTLVVLADEADSNIEAVAEGQIGWQVFAALGVAVGLVGHQCLRGKKRVAAVGEESEVDDDADWELPDGSNATDPDVVVAEPVAKAGSGDAANGSSGAGPAEQRAMTNQENGRKQAGQAGESGASRWRNGLARLWFGSWLLAAVMLALPAGRLFIDEAVPRGPTLQPAGPARVRKIEEIRVGDRLRADSPTGEEDLEFGEEVEPATWRRVELQARKKDGSWADVVLLRPFAWLEGSSARVGGTLEIAVPECGIDGHAVVLSIDPCPAICPGPGRVVTGTFRHSSARIVDVYVEGQSAPIGSTANHLFWSEDRHAFIPAGSLRPGEHLQSLAGSGRVERIEARPGSEPVFNLEVQGAHVYHVSRDGILVHNVKGQGIVVASPDAVSSYSGSEVVYVLTTSNGTIYYVGRASVITSLDQRTPRWGISERAVDHMKQGAGTEYQRFQPNGLQGDKMKLVIDEPSSPTGYRYEEINPWGDQVIPQGALRDHMGARPLEHEQMLDNQTYIGKRTSPNKAGELINDFRGNRSNTLSPNQADKYYPATSDKAYRHLPIEGRRPGPQLPKNQRPNNLEKIDGWEPKGGKAPPGDC
jgi:RHS repeat-associated protein